MTGQLNWPPVETVAPHAVIAAPLPIDTVIVAPGVKPLPATVTEAPLGPCDGVSVIASVVTVKVCVAAVVPVATSVPTTEYAPEPSLGTLKVHANAPLASVVMVVPLPVPGEHPVGACRMPLNAIVTDDESVNPLPVAV